MHITSQNRTPNRTGPDRTEPRRIQKAQAEQRRPTMPLHSVIFRLRTSPWTHHRGIPHPYHHGVYTSRARARAEPRASTSATSTSSRSRKANSSRCRYRQEGHRQGENPSTSTAPPAAAALTPATPQAAAPADRCHRIHII